MSKQDKLNVSKMHSSISFSSASKQFELAHLAHRIVYDGHITTKETKMDPLTIALIVNAAIESLKNIKSFFYDDSEINKMKQKAQDHTDSIQQEVQQNKSILNELIKQVESSKDVIEKHNEILLSLSQAIQETEKESKKIRLLSYSAIIVSLVSVAICVLLAFK